ncbi:MAG: hypothetical protein CVT78_14090 [Alphaproteobacteria bacterium HGW-Alphaproteobacteria-17]|nr:MAG: hypothetical protein CVT78_14090 [Alphaproteobacteria bacterium HGW-Alphaproteobacteria-17]
MSGGAASDGGFNPRLIAGVVVIGVIAFVALWALIALGPQLSSGNDGGGHALSKAAPGYAGIVDLLERSNADVDLRRRVEPTQDDDYTQLTILTPTARTRPEEMKELLVAQGDAPVLVVLPKWQAMTIPGQAPKPGWVSGGMAVLPPARLLPEEVFGKVRVGRAKSANENARGWVGGREIRLIDPGQLHMITGDGLDPLIVAADGSVILARARDRDRYILADPDLINNLAFSTREKAVTAARLIDAIAEDAAADGIAFDLTLNGFGSQRSLLRFAFVPPFIGITLCLIAAGLLALWQAWMRFGPALNPARAIAVSKAALIANSADLIKQARRELDGAEAYVRSQRSAIARRLHAPGGLDDAETDAWIDRHLPSGSDLFSAIARRLPFARNTHEFLADAQALHDIRKDLLRDS